jgi:hypothetical protein
MNNTEKKLDALIDALGFDVEEILIYDPLSVSNWDNKWEAVQKESENFIAPNKPTPKFEYKLTKRKDERAHSLANGLGYIDYGDL